MLIAACQQKEIKTTLIKGQTRYLKDMFVNDSEELWDLIQDLKEETIGKIRVGDFKKYIQKKGKEAFQSTLRNLYQSVVVDKSPRNYFNARILKNFKDFHKMFWAVYSYYLKELNHEDLKIIERYVSLILKSNPRYIGFSLEGNLDPLSRTIRKHIKQVSDVPIIVGGSLTPFIDREKLDEIFQEEYFDYLVIGAGERALPSLIEALDKRHEPQGNANVFYKKDGRVKQGNLEVIDDLDTLPRPDYSQFDLDLYLTPRRILPLQTARGCSWRRCAFCRHHNIDFGNCKTFSKEKVIEDLRYLRDTYECSHFFLHDEEIPPARAKMISRALLDSKLNINLNVRGRLTNGFNDDLLRLMRNAGFASITWGLESGCQRVLDSMEKGLKLPDVNRVLKQASKNRIANLCFVFFGFPGETKEEAQETVEFLKNNADYIDYISSGTFILEPYCPIGDNPRKWGVHVEEDGSFSIENGMSPEETKAFYKKFLAQIQVNTIRISSGKLEFLLPVHTSRTCHFLISSHELLSNSVFLKYIESGNLDKIFPIIPGHIRSEGGQSAFRPVNIKETVFVDKYRPQRQKALDQIEQRILALSDGTLSVEDICFTIYSDFKIGHEEECIRQQCIDFFREAFSKSWGLAFAKSWKDTGEPKEFVKKSGRTYYERQEARQ